MGIIAAGQITVVDLSDAPVLNTFITASRPTTQTYSKDSRTYKPSYASTPQVLTLKVTKAGSTANIIDSISSLHWFVVDGPIKTEITSKDNTANEYISGAHNEILTTKLDIDLNKGSKRYEVMGIWPDPSTGLDVQFGGYIDLLLTQNGATGPQGPQGNTGNGIANTVITYGLSMSDTTEPATWSSEMPTLVKGMYLWTRTVIIYTNGSSTTSYQISYIAKDADATAEIDKAKQELLEKLETVRDESLEAVDEAKQGLAEVNTKVDSAKAELTQAKQQLATVSDDLSKAKTDLQTAVSEVDTKATNLQSDLSQTKQDLTSQAQQLQAQANAQSELTKRVSTVEKTADGTKTTVNELTKTVAQNGKDITSVTNRTKTVEDDLANTKTTLNQVQTTANSASQKTATLEAGLNGLTAKFNSLSVGGTNLFKGSRDFSGTDWVGSAGVYVEDYLGVKVFKKQSLWSGRTQYFEVKTGEEYVFSAYVKSSAETDRVTFYLTHSSKEPQAQGWVGFGSTNSPSNVNIDLTDEYQRIAVKIKITSAGWIMPRIERFNSDNYLFLGGYKLERGNVATDYSPNEADIEQKVAEYKQTADQNYASLSSTVQTLDGQVQSNKTTAEQTAQGFSTRIESLETYKDGESERANAYFESAKTETAKQLTAERTAIAKDYVAKSTYTSDVTGIRNDLSATTTTANTTKTNLANYQASNDKMVASLKSSLQTTDGNVSNLQTKVEAVPGQITSAVSAVEGKIPTTVGGRNYIRNYGLTATGWAQSISGWSFEIIKDSTAKSGQYLKATCTKAGRNGFYKNLFDFSDGRFFGKQMTWSMDVKTSKNTKLNIGCEWGNAQANVNATENWQRFSKTFKVATSSNQKAWIFYSSNWNVGDIVYIRDVQLEDGSIATTPVPAIEDTESDINAISSEIKQTADGMTLLATKTELNSAKNELQSGINTATNKANTAQSTANSNAQTISTHTTQISALNTGLNAKVSQTDFNTLSGRVTTAENNITAKANELSSKITSVEGKIPTNIGTVNLVKDTGSAFVMGYGITNTTWNETKKQAILDFSVPGVNLANSSEILPQGNKFCDFKPIKGTTYTQSIMIDTDATFNPNGQARCTWFANGTHNGQKAYIKKVGEHSYQVWSTYTWNLENTALRAFDWWDLHNILLFRTTGTYLAFYKPKLTAGNLPSDWSPAPEDTASQISSLSSELKQTKDGITLLATKTELNTAKNELQSGINTATNKANSAQSTANSAQNKANSNAQTISTHTTQISALNTGLNAKVSQTDFNTLSGRVTTAENNITAKANELSSKITSVEGKLPTSVSHRNLVQGTSSRWSPFVNINTNTNWCYSLATIKYGDSTGIRDGTTINIFVYLSADELTLGGPSPSIRIQGMVIDKNGNLTWTNWDKYHPFKSKWSSNLVSGNNYRIVKLSSKVTSESFSNINGFEIGIRIDGVQSGKFHHRALMVTTGDIFPDSWSPAPEDTINQINSVSSEFKQTTDSIKASVTSLDKSTVKSSSLTINSDGIVMKAGKSTTDVANAIGSYFAVNQNAIDLFADKIKVKGNMIVDGTITGDKIKASSVDVSKIVGIDANFIKSKIEYAMIDWLKGKTITAYNDNMTIDLQDGRISFKDGSNAVYRQTADGIHTGFLHFEAGSLGGIYAAFGTTSTRQGINSKSSEFAGIRCYRVSKNGDSHDAKIDKIEVIGDTVQFGHGYRSDGTIGGGFIMDTAAYGNETPYSLNRVVKSIESLWRILHDHAKNTGYRFNDSAFINALNNEYNAWHDMHND